MRTSSGNSNSMLVQMPTPFSTTASKTSASRMAITTRTLPPIEEEAEEKRGEQQSERQLQPSTNAAMTAKGAATMAISKSHSQVKSILLLYFKFQFISGFISQTIKKKGWILSANFLFTKFKSVCLFPLKI